MKSELSDGLSRLAGVALAGYLVVRGFIGARSLLSEPSWSAMNGLKRTNPEWAQRCNLRRLNTACSLSLDAVTPTSEGEL